MNGPTPDKAYFKHSCGTEAEITLYRGGVAIGTAKLQTHGPAEASAAMLAAAPELLETLRRIDEQLVYCYNRLATTGTREGVMEKLHSLRGTICPLIARAGGAATVSSPQ